MDKGSPVSPKEAFSLFKEAIDKAVAERDVELLGGLIRKPPQYEQVRDYLADIIEDLLNKRISFPNRKPKQDLEEKRQALAGRVWEVKKEKNWKLRAVVDFVAEEMRSSSSTVWAAWGEFGPVLVATDLLRERYDLDAIIDDFMTAAREGRKLSDEEMRVLNNFRRMRREPGADLQLFARVATPHFCYEDLHT
jgi:hypothetical protein